MRVKSDKSVFETNKNAVLDLFLTDTITYVFEAPIASIKRAISSINKISTTLIGEKLKKNR